jgi:hypothetical protein
MKIDDWVFPLEIGLKLVGSPESTHIQTIFRRPAGEKGEVPDWKFLAKYFGKKGYIPAEVAILDEEIKEVSGSDTSAPL